MSDLKTCNDCGVDKPRSPEHFNRNNQQADGLMGQCKECRSAHRRAKYAEDPSKALAHVAKYREANREAVNAYKREAYASGRWVRNRNEDPAVNRARVRRWRQENPEKSTAGRARRRALFRDATCPTADPKAIEAIYSEARVLTEMMGIPMEVDHIIPIARGGKHHEDNLQILPKRTNASKGAKMPEEFEMPENVFT